jgi:BTB/POZ domain
MATRDPVINEIKTGKIWFVSWELRGIPTQTNTNALTTYAAFTCGEKVYKVIFNLFCSSDRWYSQLDFETTKGNDKSNDQVTNFFKNSISAGDENKSDSLVTVNHKGRRQNGLLRNKLQLTWPIGQDRYFPDKRFKSAATAYQEEYPDSICNFQIIIEIPENKYETRGLQFIQNNLSELLEKGLFADIKFVFKTEQIAAHSAIIAASSPVFAAMFEAGRFKESQTRTVNIEDIDSRVFRKLLQFLYTGNSGISKQDPCVLLQALFLAADKYQVDALKEICEECLAHQLAFGNVLLHLVWADLYGAGTLKEAAVTYLVQERYRVWQHKEWKEFNSKYPDLYQVCNRMVHYR